jgi:hypothetical protein
MSNAPKLEKQQQQKRIQQYRFATVTAGATTVSRRQRQDDDCERRWERKRFGSDGQCKSTSADCGLDVSMMDGAAPLLAFVGDVVPCKCTSEQRRVVTRMMCQSKNIGAYGMNGTNNPSMALLVHDFLNFTARPLGRRTHGGTYDVIDGLPYNLVAGDGSRQPGGAGRDNNKNIPRNTCCPTNVALATTVRRDMVLGQWPPPHHVTGTGRMSVEGRRPVARALCRSHVIAVRKRLTIACPNGNRLCRSAVFHQGQNASDENVLSHWPILSNC